MKVEIWSDVVCPFCAIGKRRFESALERFAERDEVEVRWRSFELDPAAPLEREGSSVTHLAEKYRISPAEAQAMQDRMTEMAADEGLTFDFERARPGNTFDAHRLIHLGAHHGLADTVGERLMRAYLCEGEPIGDRKTLVRLAGEAGLDPAEARAVLDGDIYAERVRADEAEARSLGIDAVPFFVLDRTYGVSGAQPPDTLVAALEEAWTNAHPWRARRRESVTARSR